MLATIVPDGPLHPDDALYALLAGMLVGMAMRATGRWGAVLVPIGAVLAFEQRYPGVAWESLDGRWGPLAACVATGALAALPLSGPGAGSVSARLALLSIALPVALVWAIVPDTEAAVIGGCVVAGAFVLGSAQWERRTVVMLSFVPVFAAAVGSVGRPERLWPALGCVLVAGALNGAIGWVVRRQRAGTPTTVVPAATSEVTTAPAPTTAP